MSTLLVLRHAKAADGAGLADADRPLTERGRRDAAATGDWLRAQGLVPDAVLCSAAVRTRETAAALNLGTAVTFDDGIYQSDAAALLRIVREEGSGGTLLVIGHNPTVHQLVFDLTGGAPASFPTSTLAVIDVDDPWTDLRTGTLRTLHTP
ncbi:SixA phosphatase family protein [Actinomadura flavalba]|uniref:SixA phosphatase family protein n=1 Tax=Actinomadura flavalba TaxID=1120938 RepID=UPI00035DB3ED|nr:histidine phosphatase family protein [Actinomadura flavalba]